MISYSTPLANAPEAAPEPAPTTDATNELMKLLLPAGGALLIIILLVVLLVVKSHHKSASTPKVKEKKEPKGKSSAPKNPGVKFFFENEENK